MCKKYWHRISEIIYCIYDYVLYVKTSANCLHCMHAKYIFSLRFQIVGGYYIGTNVILHWPCTLYQRPTYKTKLTCTRYVYNRCTKSPATCFGTPWVPSSERKLDFLAIVYSFYVLGNYYSHHILSKS